MRLAGDLEGDKEGLSLWREAYDWLSLSFLFSLGLQSQGLYTRGRCMWACKCLLAQARSWDSSTPVWLALPPSTPPFPSSSERIPFSTFLIRFYFKRWMKLPRLITQNVNGVTDILFLKGGSGRKMGGIHFRKRRLCWKDQWWGLMENFSFNGMCLLELRVGFSWGRVSFFIFYSQVLMDVGQVIEGDFSSFCFIFKSIWKCALC